MKNKKYTALDILNDKSLSSLSYPSNTHSRFNRKGRSRNSRRFSESRNRYVSDDENEYKNDYDGNDNHNNEVDDHSQADINVPDDEQVMTDYQYAQHIPSIESTQEFGAALVLDTNFMLTELRIVKQLRELAEKYGYIIIIPDAVIHELDGLKNSTKTQSVKFLEHESGSDSSTPQSPIHSSIEKTTTTLQSKHNPKIQKYSTKQLSVGKCARDSSEWIRSALAKKDRYIFGQKNSQKLDPRLTGDDSILDCCMYFQNQYLTVILSNDKNLCIRSLKEDMRTVTYVDGLRAEEIAQMVSSEVPLWRQELYEKLQREGPQILVRRQLKTSHQKNGSKARPKDHENEKKNVQNSEHATINDVTMKDLDGNDTHLNIDTNNTRDTHIANDVEMIAIDDGQPKHTSAIHAMEIDETHTKSSEIKKKKHKQKTSEEFKYSSNPIIESEIKSFAQKFRKLAQEKNIDKFTDELSATLVDLISPIVCKHIVDNFPDPEDVKAQLEISNLERIFVIQGQDDQKGRDGTNKNTKQEFVWDAQHTFKLKTIDSMLQVVKSFPSVFELLLKSVGSFDELSSLHGLYCEPSTYLVVKTKALTLPARSENKAGLLSRYNGHSDHNSKNGQTNEEAARKAIDNYQDDATLFIMKWADIWLDLELAAVETQFGSTDSLKSIRLKQEKQQSVEWIKEYISGTRNVLTKYVKSILNV